MAAVKAIAIAALLGALAGGAAADPDSPPRAPLGWRFGTGTAPIRGETRFDGHIGVARGLALGGMRLSAEYDLSQLSGDSSDPAIPDARGIGHRGTLVARVDLSHHDLGGHKGRLYADLELGGTALLALDSRAGTVLTPAAVVGVRLGCYTFAKGPSPTRTMDGLITLRLLTDGQATGILFATGMDFGL